MHLSFVSSLYRGEGKHASNLDTTIHLSGNNTVRHSLGGLQINITVLLELSISTEALEPSAHVLLEGLQVLRLAQIDRLLVLAHLANLRAGRHVRDAEVVVVHLHLDGARNAAAQNVLAQARLLADGARKAHAVHGVEGVHHGAHGLEAAGHVYLRLGEGGRDGVGELEEEGFTLLGGFALVAEGQGLC